MNLVSNKGLNNPVDCKPLENGCSVQSFIKKGVSHVKERRTNDGV